MAGISASSAPPPPLPPLSVAVHGRPPGMLQSMKLRLQRLSPFARSSKRDSAIRAGAIREGSREGSARGQKQHAAEAPVAEAVAVAVAGMNGSAVGVAVGAAALPSLQPRRRGR